MILLTPILYIPLRFILLNAIIFSTALLLGTGSNLIESGGLSIVFPVLPLVTSLFLSNLVYLLGIGYEGLYHRLWKKKMDLASVERQFFKAGLLMHLIVTGASVILYFLS